MTSQVLGAASNQPSPGQPVTERTARFWPGLRMLVLCIVVLLAGVALAVRAGHDHGGAAMAVPSLATSALTAAMARTSSAVQEKKRLPWWPVTCSSQHGSST
jgi:hypothetical protein